MTIQSPPGTPRWTDQIFFTLSSCFTPEAQTKLIVDIHPVPGLDFCTSDNLWRLKNSDIIIHSHQAAQLDLDLLK
jgi:hypothetical protein